MYSNITMPVMVSPYEGESLYANGGIPQVIIDKKALGIRLNGIEFLGLSVDDTKKLKDHALKLGFEHTLPIHDALKFGGSMYYPVFKKEKSTHAFYASTLEELMKEGICDANQITRFVGVDRWNAIMIPDFDLTSDSYVKPSSFFIPISGKRINSERCAMIKPIQLSYWGTVSQIGWSTSDFVGYIKDVIDYDITIKTLPVLFQQMSLLFQLIPLDQVILISGKNKAQEVADFNSEQLRQANIMNPKALNAMGDIKVIDRTFTGVEPIIGAMRKNLCAKAKLQESIIFDIQSSGFGKDEISIKLKQSESVKMLGNIIAPQLNSLVKILVIDCFGVNSVQAQTNVTITFNPSIVLSEQEKAEKGLKAAQFIQYMTNSNIPLHIALEGAKQYFNYEISEEHLNELKKINIITMKNEKQGQPGQLNTEKNHNLKT
jgi:hypothetical protein